MVAYGVLVMKHKGAPSLADYTAAGEAEAKKDDFERDQLRKVVNDELKRYGLLLQRDVVPSGQRYRTRANMHILYGQVTGSNVGRGFVTREVLHKGDFKECCEHAAKLLDQLDAAQVPDVETRPDEA